MILSHIHIIVTHCNLVMLYATFYQTLRVRRCVCVHYIKIIFSLQLRSSRGSTSRNYVEHGVSARYQMRLQSQKNPYLSAIVGSEDLSEDLTRIQSRIPRGRYNSDDTLVRARRVNVYLAIAPVFHLINNFPKASATPASHPFFFIVLLGCERPRSRSRQGRSADRWRQCHARHPPLLEYTCVHRWRRVKEWLRNAPHAVSRFPENILENILCDERSPIFSRLLSITRLDYSRCESIRGDFFVGRFRVSRNAGNVLGTSPAGGYTITPPDTLGSSFATVFGRILSLRGWGKAFSSHRSRMRLAWVRARMNVCVCVRVYIFYLYIYISWL